MLCIAMWSASGHHTHRAQKITSGNVTATIYVQILRGWHDHLLQSGHLKRARAVAALVEDQENWNRSKWTIWKKVLAITKFLDAEGLWHFWSTFKKRLEMTMIQREIPKLLDVDDEEFGQCSSDGFTSATEEPVDDPSPRSGSEVSYATTPDAQDFGDGEKMQKDSDGCWPSSETGEELSGVDEKAQWPSPKRPRWRALRLQQPRPSPSFKQELTPSPARSPRPSLPSPPPPATKKEMMAMSPAVQMPAPSPEPDLGDVPPPEAQPALRMRPPPEAMAATSQVARNVGEMSKTSPSKTLPSPPPPATPSVMMAMSPAVQMPAPSPEPDLGVPPPEAQPASQMRPASQKPTSQVARNVGEMSKARPSKTQPSLSVKLPRKRSYIEQVYLENKSKAKQANLDLKVHAAKERQKLLDDNDKAIPVVEVAGRQDSPATSPKRRPADVEDGHHQFMEETPRDGTNQEKMEI